MSRSNYDKPFYVDVGTSIAAIRCASDDYVIDWMDHHGYKDIIKIIEDKCDRLNQEAKQFYAPTGNTASMRAALEKCVDLILRFGNAELIETPIDVIIDIEMILKDALRRAAPRNLDLYECEEDAWLAFSNAHGGINASTDEYEKWLFERSEQTEKGK